MIQRPDLLRAVIESPDQDAPRLAFARFLARQGEKERAEFIRVQCQIAQMTGSEGKPLTKLARRERELWEAHRAAWVEDLPKWARNKVYFRRGFPTILSCTQRQWMGAGGLLSRAPIQSLKIDGWNSTRRPAFVTTAHLAGIRAIRLHSFDELERAQAIQDLSSSACAPSLRILDLYRGAITHGSAKGDVLAKALARSKFSSLECLRLGWCQIGPMGVKALANAAIMSGLRKLDLEWNPVGFKGARALANSTHLGNLTALSLAECGITDRGVQALANSPHLGHLTHLNLRGYHLTVASAQAVANSPHLTRLTALSFHFGSIGQAGAQALASSPNLTRLTYLNLFGNAIGDTGLQALIDSPYLTSLQTLELGNNGLTATGLRALAQAPGLANLERIGLWGTPVKDVVSAFKARTHLPRLRETVFHPKWNEQATRQEIDEHFLPFHGETLAKRL